MGRRIRVWGEGKMYHGTLQCVDRMFMLRPDPKVNRILGASLGRALAKHPVELHGFGTNINHLGFVFSIGAGQVGNASRFLQMFANLSSRELNRHYGREGHFWSGRSRIEEILDDESAEMMLAYDACNPVKDGLVAAARQWKGFSTNGALASGTPLRFEYLDRTGWWKTSNGSKKVPKKNFVKTVSIELVPLPAWRKMTPEQRQSRFRKLLRGEQKRARQKREAEGRSVIGAQQVARRSPFDRPQGRRQRSPQKLCHATSKEAIAEYRKNWCELRSVHLAASDDYLKGIPNVEFPQGTFKPPLLALAA